MSESAPDRATQLGDELLLELADDYLRRYRAGEQPTVDEYVAKRSEFADRIRELFSITIAMEQPGPGATVEPGNLVLLMLVAIGSCLQRRRSNWQVPSTRQRVKRFINTPVLWFDPVSVGHFNPRSDAANGF